MNNSSAAEAATASQLQDLMQAFFRAVSFEPGQSPAYQAIHALFIDQGLLIKNTGPQPEISTVQQFIGPRQAMFDAGELTRFHETELQHRTDVFGQVAQRFSAYGKSGTLKGADFQARGMISTQFILTPQGWKMSSMAWDDELPGNAAQHAAIEAWLVRDR